jgi:hypothetical protein
MIKERLDAVHQHELVYALIHAGEYMGPAQAAVVGVIDLGIAAELGDKLANPINTDAVSRVMEYSVVAPSTGALALFGAGCLLQSVIAVARHRGQPR